MLDAALDRLTLARAGLYRAILSCPPSTVETSIDVPRAVDFDSLGVDVRQIDATVDGLRGAGAGDYLPHGLLTRAWFRYLTGDFKGSGEDLDETEEIARRGPMPLVLADVFLTRARLFGRPNQEGPYPWGSPREDLAEARRLIEKHGYHRRDEELADAEAAIG